MGWARCWAGNSERECDSSGVIQGGEPSVWQGLWCIFSRKWGCCVNWRGRHTCTLFLKEMWDLLYSRFYMLEFWKKSIEIFILETLSYKESGNNLFQLLHCSDCWNILLIEISPWFPKTQSMGFFMHGSIKERWTEYRYRYRTKIKERWTEYRYRYRTKILSRIQLHLLWTVQKVYFSTPGGLWDPSSPTKDGTPQKWKTGVLTAGLPGNFPESTF